MVAYIGKKNYSQLRRVRAAHLSSKDPLRPSLGLTFPIGVLEELRLTQIYRQSQSPIEAHLLTNLIERCSRCYQSVMAVSPD